MTRENALKLLKQHEYWAEFSYFDEMAIIASEALEKQMPKKPLEMVVFTENDLVGICPICNEGVHNEMKYCMECGQALDWSVE